jgi:hypothetical protein
MGSPKRKTLNRGSRAMSRACERDRRRRSHRSAAPLSTGAVAAKRPIRSPIADTVSDGLVEATRHIARKAIVYDRPAELPTVDATVAAIDQALSEANNAAARQYPTGFDPGTFAVIADYAARSGVPSNQALSLLVWHGLLALLQPQVQLVTDAASA